METQLNGEGWLADMLRHRTARQVHDTIGKRLACYVPDKVMLRDASSGIALAAAMR